MKGGPDLGEDIAKDHEALLQFLYLAPVGLVQASLDGDIVLANPISAQLLMPLSRDGDLSNLFAALETVAPDLKHLVATFAKPHGLICDAQRIQLTARGGRTGPRMLSLSLLKLDHNRLMAVLSDITQQVARERLLKQNEAWLNAILTDVTDYALIRLNQRGCVDAWNPSIERVTGFGRTEVLGKPFSIFYPDGGTTPDRLMDRLREADDNGWSLDDGWRVKADGKRFWGSGMISPLRQRLFPGSSASDGQDQTSDPSEPAYCLVIRDITDKREAGQLERRINASDRLTGVANRRAFFEATEIELTRARRSPRKLSIVVFEIDDIDGLAAAGGASAGDAVLCHLAGLLTATFREVDVVGRVGSAEFAVLLPSTDASGASGVAERLRRAVQSGFVDASGHRVRYTVSGGVVTLDGDAVDLDDAMHRAGSALEAARAGGRNRVVSWSRRDSMPA